MSRWPSELLGAARSGAGTRVSTPLSVAAHLVLMALALELGAMTYLLFKLL